MRHPAKEPSQRQLRVGEEVRHALAWLLERGEVHDPILSGTPLTVTEVRVSPDLKNATAFITPLGGAEPEKVKEILAALKRASGYLRHEVIQKVQLKFAPRLSFQFDDSFDNADHIGEILRSQGVQRDIHPDDEDSDEDPRD